MSVDVLANTDIHSIKIDAVGIAITVEPTTDKNIKLMYSSGLDFHVHSAVIDGVLTIRVDGEIVRRYVQFNNTLKIYIPENLIGYLEIVSIAAYVHINGNKKLFQSCNIKVDAGALYLENMYGDTVVKTITGAIRLKNQSIQSNIQLETMIGVIDVALGQLADNVSLYASGTVKRNAFARTRNTVSLNPQYSLRVRSRLGVIHIH